MDRFRLKNIIILILALLNICLLASLLLRQTFLHSAQKDTLEQLVALFAADGISLDPESIPDTIPPSGYTLSRDSTLEQEAAELLLGEGLTFSDQGGGICSYSTQRGVALFRSTGSFDAAGTLFPEDPQAMCQEFCQKLGYDDPIFLLDESGSGTATAVRIYHQTPVFNCSVTFTFDRGTVIAVSGVLLPNDYTETDSQQQPLSAQAALTTFQQMRRSSGAVVSVISEIYLVYELQNTAAVPMSLVPAWCIVTDTATYYVNCLTGAIRQA